MSSMNDRNYISKAIISDIINRFTSSYSAFNDLSLEVYLVDFILNNTSDEGVIDSFSTLYEPK